MGKARWCRRSVRGRLELREREMRAGKGAVKLEKVARLLLGSGGASGRKCRWVTGGDLRPTPLMAGEGVNGDSRGGIKAGE
jgi:hypothetical protein